MEAEAEVVFVLQCDFFFFSHSLNLSVAIEKTLSGWFGVFMRRVCPCKHQS